MKIREVTRKSINIKFIEDININCQLKWYSTGFMKPYKGESGKIGPGAGVDQLTEGPWRNG